jgi:hypothetical protein
MNFETGVDWSGRREDSSENANAFPSCVGRFEEAYSRSCGLSWTGETPQTPKAIRRLNASPAESEAPGTEINGPILQANLKKRMTKSLYLFGPPLSFPSTGLSLSFLSKLSYNWKLTCCGFL